MPRTIWDNDEAAANERQRRRFAAEEREIDRIDRGLELAETKIGVLCREGKIVHYINLLPLHKGRVLEGTKAELQSYLIRNSRRYL